MQTPDIPLTMSNCRMLGFDVDIESKNYYLAHEFVVRQSERLGNGTCIVCNFFVSDPYRKPRA